MKIKVCGITQLEQVKQLDILGIDYIGFIHYTKSPRHVAVQNLKTLAIPTKAEKVLVTVDEDFENVCLMAQILNCKTLQLHGLESPELCQKYKALGYTIFKAIGIKDSYDFETLKPYESSVNYFLFDYKGKEKGGNGLTYNWNLLIDYQLNTDFILSGGLSNDNALEIAKFKHPKCKAVDINSKFETAPGIKDLTKVEVFVETIKTL